MLFPSHLVAAYLLATRWSLAPAWVVAGAALPDVVDKPVAMAGLYGLYHSAGHSALVLLVASLLGLGLIALGRAGLVSPGRGPGREVGLAVWTGWTSHLVLDAVNMPLNGRPGDIRFLAWPVVEHTPSVRLPPLEFAVHYVGTPGFYVELLIWAVFVAVLVGHPWSDTPSQ